MNAIDKLAYASKISDISAGEKIAFSMIPLLFCLLAPSFVLHSTVFILMSVFTVKYSALSIKKYTKLLCVPATFIVLGLITIIFDVKLTNTDDVFVSFHLFKLNIYITYIGLYTAFDILMRAMASISCFYFLILNTPMNNLFSFLQSKKVSPLLVTLTELIYRFSFVLFGQLERIRTAQLSRLGYLSFKNGIRSSSELLAMTFESAMIKVDHIDVVLNSRCFDGSFKMIAGDESKTNLLKSKTIVINIILFIVLMLEVYFKWIY